ncbi:MAG TPA: hypothetical protein VKB79_09040 [Bryobacteraceae bacterium]|nr:hypothetical protein [Bryobacteraceae bacterium]
MSVLARFIREIDALRDDAIKRAAASQLFAAAKSAVTGESSTLRPKYCSAKRSNTGRLLLNGLSTSECACPPTRRSKQ